MKKQIKSPLIAGKGMQLFSDEEMMPRKTMTQHTVLSFKTIPIILVILRKTIIFAHSDA